MSNSGSRQTACEDAAPASTVAAGAASGNNNYSFLVHSNKTLTQDLPPKVDSKQRRRRTSPEDHAILEAEYQLNPKPDKATRASIVSRVSLEDREVQIWFQNRRQHDRRKSKPIPIPTSQVASITQTPGSSQQAVPSSSPSNGQNEPASSSIEFACSNSQCTHITTSSRLKSSQTSTASTTAETDRCSFCSPISEPRERARLSSLKRKRADSAVSGLGSGGVRASKRSFENQNSPSLRLSMSFDGEAVVRGQDESTPSPPKLRDSLRISFSADGEAVVRTAGEPSPSPSRTRTSTPSSLQSRLRSLRRTSSAVTPGTPNFKTPETTNEFGRSRDSRRWELYCDTDARSALSSPHTSTSAHTPDQIGSRKPASRLSLSENTYALSPCTNVQTSTIPSDPPPQKRKKLSRAVSSLGRLETDPSATNKLPRLGGFQKSRAHGSKSRKDTHNGDSDKENWLPGTQTIGTRRRRLQNEVQPKHHVLKSSGDARREGNRILGREPMTHRKGEGRDRNDENGQKAPAVSDSGSNQVEDLDCIQGLLSLSQGAWK